MPAGPTIYLIRHGETAWNVEEVFRGRADIPLNERGREQAEAIAVALGAEPIAGVYSGPLRRARMTAEPLARRHGLQVRVDERLTDLDFGQWEGLAVDEARRRWPELFARWAGDPGSVVLPEGESLPMVRERALTALEEITAAHPDAAAVVVSHRVVTKVLLLAVLGLDDSHFWQIRQDTACINRLQRLADYWAVVGINDRCHLRGDADARDF